MQGSDVSKSLEELCEKYGVSVELMRKMLQEERDIRHLKRRRGVTERLRWMIEKSLGVAE
ncbi:MAG: hypothetical protein ACOC6F_01225 [bacterium]